MQQSSVKALQLWAQPEFIIGGCQVSLPGLNLLVLILPLNFALTATCCLQKHCYLNHTLANRKNACLMLNGLTFSSALIMFSLSNIKEMNTKEQGPVEHLAHKVLYMFLPKQVQVILQFTLTGTATHGYFKGCCSVGLYPFIPRHEL